MRFVWNKSLVIDFFIRIQNRNQRINMFGVALVVIAFALIAYMLYKLSSNDAQYFEQRNLKYISVAATLKNLFGMMLRRYDMMEFSRKIYDQFPNEK